MEFSIQNQYLEYSIRLNTLLNRTSYTYDIFFKNTLCRTTAYTKQARFNLFMILPVLSTLFLFKA